MDPGERFADAVPLTPIRWNGASRLIASRYPTIGVFDRVAPSSDLEALFELESWTNDRISHELGILSTLPADEWVTGPMSTVVTAAFCHPSPDGGRFSGPDRGAWYAASTVETAIAESTYRRSKELGDIGAYETRVEMRLYHADFRASFHDVRRRDRAFARLYDPDSYERSQAFGRRLLENRSNGVVYRSVRYEAGECMCCFRPRLVQGVRVAGHYEYRWEGSPAPNVRRLA